MILPATLFFLLIWRYSMKTLRRNDRGNDVKKWQLFLIGQGHLRGEADGIFGEATEKASKAFQKNINYLLMALLAIKRLALLCHLVSR
jgi:hypothetical protein